ncbi:MAG: hypothetical protein IJX97_00295 [Clostridia bacterium]|nr:hypothetical protein [Clostridia bacterium]
MIINNSFNFKNAPDNYGEVPFFWWHGDDITKEKLSWILDQLKNKNICGLQINYCHGNKGGRSYGLTMNSNPKPFSDPWWELVEWFVGECKKYGMSVSLSDYTLGSPGQEYYVDWVLEKHPEMLGQRLGLNEDGEIVVETVPFSMNPMAKGIGDSVVEEFYGEFEKHIPNECGTGINFFFSDELNFNISGNLWCDDFKEEFLKRKGYDITEKWKAIFEDIGPETPKIRLDYYDVIVQLSEERYFKVVYDWHENRGMTFGCDHGGRGQKITEFGDYFRTMKWNQGPGNDQPGLRSDVIKSKCSASIAHMYQRPRVWLEGFYSSGWATGSAEVADATFRNFALGHNLLSLHGLYYSTHGSMWEWAPPCNHHHMPYWDQMGKFLECTKRLSYMNASGVHCCDVAIIYPVAVAEADISRARTAPATAFETAKYLYAHGIDFDFIDFESIERATVEDGKLCVSGEAFSAVIVPEMDTVRFAMMPKLLEFAKNGGQVIFQKCLPTASDRIGREDKLLDEIVDSILEIGAFVDSPCEVVQKMSEHHVFDFYCDSQSPFVHHRKIDNKDYYMIYRVPLGTRLCMRTGGYPVVLNPWDGSARKLENFSSSKRTVGTITEAVTEITMPMTDREVFVVAFEQDEAAWSALKPFVPFSDENELITMDGVWKSELIPTMNNVYGDWRLPAFDGYIGAEARKLEYCYCDKPLEIPADAEWKSSVYSYGTHFWTVSGEQNEEELINATSPNEAMKEYRFSAKYGVEGDAGAQQSYHGLKGFLSDDFLVMGTKRLTYANSDSVYEGDEPHYFFTTVNLDKTETVTIDTGDFKPDKIWIDHKEITDESITLEAGRHYILLRFARGGRSHFVLRHTNSFKQTRPLVTNWFKNPDVIAFEAMPELDGHYCCYRFIAPVGAKKMKISSSVLLTAYANGKELTHLGNNEFEIGGDGRATEITLYAKQGAGLYDTAIFDEPISFETGVGMYNFEFPYDEQGLNFYSGGISLKKTVHVEKTDKPIFFAVNSDVGCAMDIYVNGKKADTLLTKPYRCEITEYLRDGNNEIEVRAFNDLHNHMKTVPTQYNKRIDIDTMVVC